MVTWLTLKVCTCDPAFLCPDCVAAVQRSVAIRRRVPAKVLA